MVIFYSSHSQPLVKISFSIFFVDDGNLLSTSALHHGYWTPFFQSSVGRSQIGSQKDAASDPDYVKNSELQGASAPSFLTQWRSRLRNVGPSFDVLKRHAMVHDEAEPIEFLG